MKEKRDTKDRLIVLAASFVLFVGGVLALQLDRGPVRTAVLVVCIAGLLLIATRQTVRKVKGEK